MVFYEEKPPFIFCALCTAW